jgi:hypothetical protein
MMSARIRGVCVVTCGFMLVFGSKAQTLDNGATQAAKIYADSRSGIEEQFADILESCAQAMNLQFTRPWTR